VAFFTFSALFIHAHYILFFYSIHTKKQTKMKLRKILIQIGVLLLAIPVMMLSCQKLDNNDPAPAKKDNIQLSEKMAAYESLGIAYEKSVGSSDLIYAATLCPGNDIYASAGALAINYPANWMYYKFYGVAGQNVNISLVRVSCQMDPAFSLFFGTSATTEGIYYGGSTNPDLQWLIFRDDNLDPPAFCENSCFAFWDPNGIYTLPYTGWYTLGVYDFISCGGVNPLDYHLTITGLTACGTIVIDGCDTYVNNLMVDGYYMQYHIDQLAVNPKNHGAYVSSVARLCAGWVRNGLITIAEKDAIVACAAESGIPYPD
jgi:hypothetical protein